MTSWRLSQRASADLIGIYADGISRFGKAQARKYRESLEQSFDALAATPRIGREHVGADMTVRVHFHQAHVVTYTIDTHRIVIVRLLPARSEWKECL